MSWYLQKPIAHRGLHDGSPAAPENSVAAFARAMEMGYPIELDVRCLRDDTVVVFHDVGLDRLTGERGSISNINANEARRLRLFGGDQSVPFLRDVLEFVDGVVPLLVEVKNETPSVGRLEEGVARLLTEYAGEFAVQSFNPYSLKWFADHAQGFERGQLSGAFEDSPLPGPIKRKLRDLAMNHVSKPHFVGYEARWLPYDKVEKLRAAGTPVLAWTIKSREEQTRVGPFCDNIIFEGYNPNVH